MLIIYNILINDPREENNTYEDWNNSEFSMITISVSINNSRSRANNSKIETNIYKVDIITRNDGTK